MSSQAAGETPANALGVGIEGTSTVLLGPALHPAQNHELLASGQWQQPVLGNVPLTPQSHGYSPQGQALPGCLPQIPAGPSASSMTVHSEQGAYHRGPNGTHASAPDASQQGACCQGQGPATRAAPLKESRGWWPPWEVGAGGASAQNVAIFGQTGDFGQLGLPDSMPSPAPEFPPGLCLQHQAQPQQEESNGAEPSLLHSRGCSPALSILSQAARLPRRSQEPHASMLYMTPPEHTPSHVPGEAQRTQHGVAQDEGLRAPQGVCLGASHGVEHLLRSAAAGSPMQDMTGQHASMAPLFTAGPSLAGSLRGAPHVHCEVQIPSQGVGTSSRGDVRQQHTDAVQAPAAPRPALAHPVVSAALPHVLAPTIVLAAPPPACAPPGVSLGTAAVSPVYAGVFLNASSQRILRDKVVPRLPSVSADHMTIMFAPGWDSFSAFKQLPLGVVVELDIVGVLCDSKVQVLVVKPAKVLGTLNPPAPHITVSVGHGVQAREAGLTVAELTPSLAAGLLPPSFTPLPFQLLGSVGIKMSDGSILTSKMKLTKLHGEFCATTMASLPQVEPAGHTATAQSQGFVGKSEIWPADNSSMFRAAPPQRPSGTPAAAAGNAAGPPAVRPGLSPPRPVTVPVVHQVVPNALPASGAPPPGGSAAVQPGCPPRVSVLGQQLALHVAARVQDSSADTGRLAPSSSPGNFPNAGTTVAGDAPKAGVTVGPPRAKVRFAPGTEGGSQPIETSEPRGASGRGLWEANKGESQGSAGSNRSVSSTARVGLDAFPYRGEDVTQDWDFKDVGQVKVFRRGQKVEPSGRPISQISATDPALDLDEDLQALLTLDVDIKSAKARRQQQPQRTPSSSATQGQSQMGSDRVTSSSASTHMHYASRPDSSPDPSPSSDEPGHFTRPLQQDPLCTTLGSPSDGDADQSSGVSMSPPHCTLRGPLHLDAQTWQQLQDGLQPRRPPHQPGGVRHTGFVHARAHTLGGRGGRHHGGVYLPERHGPPVRGPHRPGARSLTPPLVRSPDLAEKDIIDAWKTAGGLARAPETVQAVDQADQRRSVSQSLDPADSEHARRLAEDVKLLREMCPHLTLDMAVVLLKVWSLQEATEEALKHPYITISPSRPLQDRSLSPSPCKLPGIFHVSQSTPNLQLTAGNESIDGSAGVLLEAEEAAGEKLRLQATADGLRRKWWDLHQDAERLRFNAEQEKAKGNTAVSQYLYQKYQENKKWADDAREAANSTAFVGSNKIITNRNQVDLHGLHVDEAVKRVAQIIEGLYLSQMPGKLILEVITGQGLHSVNGKARILPAIISHLLYLQVEFKGDPANAGVLEVELQHASHSKPDRSALARQRNLAWLASKS